MCLIRLSLCKLQNVIFICLAFTFNICIASRNIAYDYGLNYRNGRKTASGRPYDKNKLTAAHKTLPFGTVVKVTNKKNGKTVEVEITDRGPFVRGRIIDLSVAAAKKIGMIKCGVTQVHIDIVRQPTTIKKKR